MAEHGRDRSAVAMGGFLTFAGLMHFASPTFFENIVPPWLPPNERFWVSASGVAEIVVGAMLMMTRRRRWPAYAAMGLFVAVYPANLYMAWDWRDRPASEQFIAYARLPFQFLLIWLAWRMAKRSNPTAAPTDIAGAGRNADDRPAHTP